MSEYKTIQAREKMLTEKIQSLNWVDSFANEILLKKNDIKTQVDKLPKVKFDDYSGVNQLGYLGKFFYIARYVDEIEKTKYMDLDHIPIGSPSPINNIKNGAKFDKKPWDVNWIEIPLYTKEYIFIHHTNLGVKLKQDLGKENSEEFKQRVWKVIGDIYDKKSKSEKIDFIKGAAIAGTRSPIVQAQVGGKTYIQGYIMNILELNSNNTKVKLYYDTAIKANMGLLSGPSGTAHRVSNLVNEIFGVSYDLTMKIKTAALCLAALGVPYNCHSFYEIVTVVLPNNSEYHNISEFSKAVDKI